MNIASARNEQSINNLIVKLKSSKPPIAFIGAGVSIGAKYPSWEELMEKMHQAALKKISKYELLFDRGVSPKYLSQLKLDSDLPWRAQEYKRILGSEFQSILKKTFSGGRSPSPLAQHLVRMNFSHFVTTNFEMTLENALSEVEKNYSVIEWSCDISVRNFLASFANLEPTKYCVFLHGRFPKVDEFIVCDSDYISRYSSTDWTTKKLLAILLTQSVVFVGYSLNDPDLKSLLRIAKSHLPDQAPHHFVFLPLHSSQEEKLIYRKYQELYGITPIFYRQTAEHEELLNLLVEIDKEVKRKGKSQFVIPESVIVRDLRQFAPNCINGKPIKHFDDPNKELFGGSAEVEGFSLNARVTAHTQNSKWYKVELSVKHPKPFEKNKVTFYLHDTFKPSKVTVAPIGGVSKHNLLAYGAFTVGVKVLGTNIDLELDLAELTAAPLPFRMR